MLEINVIFIEINVNWRGLETYTLSDKISADKTAENLTCFRKVLSAENFVCRNILSAEIKHVKLTQISC